MSKSFKDKIRRIAKEVEKTEIPVELKQLAKEKWAREDFFVPKMHKVPPLLRLDKNNRHDYDPLVVSLGPYHYGKPELMLAENFKLIALQTIAKDSVNMAFLYQEIRDKVIEANACYVDDGTAIYQESYYNNFAYMLLLDAAFIINFILATKYEENYYLIYHFLGDLVYDVILRDILLLENQIPYSILKHLICVRYGNEQGENLLNSFFRQVVIGQYKLASSDQITAAKDVDPQEEPLHLLAAVRQILIKDYPDIGERTEEDADKSNQGSKGKGQKADDQQDVEKYMYVPNFGSVMDLKAKGIHFKPGNSESLKAIKFKPGYLYAQLEVPTCYISTYTKVFLLNLMAYEMCPGTITNRGVTAYIDFMKSLIDNPKDVKELKEKKILFCTIGSDEEVVKLYKEIRTYELSNIRLFHKVKKEIEAHYNSHTKTWLAELIFTYFRSPWTVIALFAAIFLLLLTFLQTYFTVRLE